MSPDLPTGAVRFENVCKEYVLGRPRAHLRAALPWGDGLGKGDRLKALDDVSFDIMPGESFALIGANGAGKSTALKCLAGVIDPTSGAVQVGGRIVPLIELGIGFHPDLTGRENARFAAVMAGIRGQAVERVVDAAIAFSELERFIDTPVKRYSSGMFARLSFGIATGLPADVLIVDEILSVGDAAFQRKCYGKLQELRQNGTTLLFVSHNEWVLKETCTRGVLLSHGRVVKLAGIDEILVTYQGLVAGDHSEREVAATGHRMHLSDIQVPGAGPSRTVGLHEPFVVEARVKVDATATSAVVAVAFADRERRIIWASYSDEEGLALPAGGTYSVRMEVPDLSVLPGPGLFEVFAFDRSSPVVEATRILEVTVTGEGRSSTWQHGMVHAPAQWTADPAP